MPDFLLPDLGEGLTEAEIVGWLVQVGDEVSIDQPVVEVETAKASVEVPVPFAGTVTVLHAQPGVMVPVGAPLITVAEKGAEQGAEQRATKEPGKTADSAESAGGGGEHGTMGGLREPGIEIAPSPAAGAGAGSEGSGNVLIGYGTPAAARSRRRRPHRPGPATSRNQGPDATGPARPITSATSHFTSQSPHTRPTWPPRERGSENGGGYDTEGVPPENGGENGDGGGPVVRVISPLARRIAREARLDLRLVTGSGPHGLIMRTDIRRAIEERDNAVQARPGAKQQPAPQSQPGPQPRPDADSQPGPHTRPGPQTHPGPHTRPGLPGEDVPGFERIPFTGVRRFAAEKFARSRREIPEATIWVDADATLFLAARSTLNSAQPSAGAPAHWASPAQPVSLVALLARFVVAGLRRFPELNATVENDEIHRHHAVHLGFAAQTERGLVVPVVHHADRLTTRGLAAALQQKTTAARDGRLAPADLTGGTFTVNNYGVFGTDGAAAIINHPEAAILGIGRIVDRPWVVDGQLAVRKVTQLTLSFDHRVCDGATAGGLLRFVADCVENPVTALGDL